MSNPKTQVWNTCGYVRLSHEDGDKEESNSVTGQKDLIRDYFRCHEDLRECLMKVDDGYTGSNFDRPAFKEMIEEVKAGRINCIVVKDLSRFGREYLGTGEYLERVFPVLGVRFIAINDHYDSLYRNPTSDDLVIPFKNLVNEAYCRDTSIKIRSQLEIKRQRGDYIGNFATFGYKKDPSDHHKLIIDEYAADVVRDVFQWKLSGISVGDIAKELNRNGIPTPMDYKRAQGTPYNTPFRKKANSVWSATMVLRILKNPVYIGILEQGKVTTPSYKVKQIIKKPKEEWAVVESCHEAIVEKSDFETVQRVLALDTHTGSSGKAVDLFSGLICCGECGAPMVRKTVPSRNSKYTYYVCSAHKKSKSCYSHAIRDQDLEKIVLDLLTRHISEVMCLSDIISVIDTARMQKLAVKKLHDRLSQKQQEIGHIQTLLHKLYESLADGLIDEDEYAELKKTYTQHSMDAEAQIEIIRAQIHDEMYGNTDACAWIEQFRRHRNLSNLDRAAVVTLIDKVLIYRDHRVEIAFRWQNEYREISDLTETARLNMLQEAM